MPGANGVTRTKGRVGPLPHGRRGCSCDPGSNAEFRRRTGVEEDVGYALMRLPSSHTASTWKLDHPYRARISPFAQSFPL